MLLSLKVAVVYLDAERKTLYLPLLTLRAPTSSSSRQLLPMQLIGVSTAAAASCGVDAEA